MNDLYKQNEQVLEDLYIRDDLKSFKASEEKHYIYKNYCNRGNTYLRRLLILRKFSTELMKFL